MIVPSEFLHSGAMMKAMPFTKRSRSVEDDDRSEAEKITEKITERKSARAQQKSTSKTKLLLSYIYIYIHTNIYSPAKVDSSDLEGSYSVSKGGALSTAPIGFPDCVPTGFPRLQHFSKFPPCFNK